MSHFPIRRSLGAPRGRAAVGVPGPRQLGARVAQVAASLVLLLCFLKIYESYISVVWAYLGMTYRAHRPWELLTIVLQVSVVAAAMPTRLSRPSVIIVWMLFAFVFVPTVTLTPILGVHDGLHYLPATSLLTGIFLLLTAVSQAPLRRKVEGQGVFRDEIDLIFLVIWAMSSAILLYAFRDILTFSTVDDIYVQRALAGDLSGGAINYIQTYYTYVMTPAVLAIGMTKAKPHFVVLGLVGFLITYLIDAQKLALIVPVVMTAIWAAYRFRRTSVAYFTSGLALLVAVCAGLTSHTALTSFVINVLVFRAIAVPGQVFSMYYDLFAARGFTWWSNTRGISLLVPPPAAYAADPNWPALGRVVGAEIYGQYATNVNVNANAFAGEGVAAGGLIGLAVIGLVMAAWLRLVDVVSGRWNLQLVTLLMLPIGLCLTNVHLTTVILSFGGGFWLLVFYMARPSGAAARTAPSPGRRVR